MELPGGYLYYLGGIGILYFYIWTVKSRCVRGARNLRQTLPITMNDQHRLEARDERVPTVTKDVHDDVEAI